MRKKKREPRAKPDSGEGAELDMNDAVEVWNY
jgi:hypothetical protein